MNSDQILVMNGTARNVVMAVTADDPTTRQFVGLIVEYIGAEDSCLITTASNNSIASAIGAEGSEAADTNFTVGSTPGTIDLTNAAANTMGEVVDFINNLADYKARLVCLRRADDADTTGALVAVTSQQAKVSGGLKLAVDTSVADHVSCELSILDGTMFSGGSTSGQTADNRQVRNIGGLNGDYKRSSLVELYQVDETLTYSGTGTFEVIEVDDFNKTDEVIYSGGIPAASTSAGSKSFGQLGVSGITARVGRRLIVRLRAATSVAVSNLAVYGKLKSIN